MCDIKPHMERLVLAFGALLAHPRRSSALVALLLSPALLMSVLWAAGWGGHALLANHLRAAAGIALEAAVLGGDPIEQERLALAALQGAVWAPLRRHVSARAQVRDGGLTLTVGCDVGGRAPAPLAAVLALPPVRILRRVEADAPTG